MSDVTDAADLGVVEAAALLRAGRLSSVELTEACLHRVQQRNGSSPTLDGAPDAVNAWVRLYPELAREHAEAADARRAREGEATPLLCGIPVGVKDLYAVEGLPLTASSRVLDPGTPAAGGYEVAVDACRRLGARIVELPVPWTFDWDDLSWVLMAEVWAYHRAHADRHDRYRPQVAEFIETARNFTDAQAYLAAQMRRSRGTAAWERWFGQNAVDIVLEPTLPILPPERGGGYERCHPAGPGDPMIALTALWDMTGMPVVSLPVTWSVGISLIAPRGREAALAQTAIDLQDHALGIPADPLRP